MDISKFLLIDALFAITVVLTLFIFKLKNKMYSLLKISNNEKSLDTNSYKLPKKEKLLDFEKNAIRKGSEIDFDSVIGNWKFVSIWKDDSSEEDSIFSSLLRNFSAKIEFKQDISTENPNQFLLAHLLNLDFSPLSFLVLDI